MLRRFALSLILAGSLLPGKLLADDFADEHRRAVAKNPAGLSFELSLVETRPYRIGETISVRLRFSGEGSQGYVLNASAWDRAGRLHLDRFVASPREYAVDPAADYYLSGVTSVRGGGALVRADLREGPKTLEFALNQWLRFDRPGSYRVYALSDRVAELGSNSSNSVASNWLEIEILPRDLDWERAVIERSVHTLAGCAEAERRLPGIPPVFSADRHKELSDAADALRYLGSDQSVDAVFESWGVCGGTFDLQLTLALVGARNRDSVRARFDAALLDPAIGVEASDLELAAILAGAEQADWRIPAVLPNAPKTDDLTERLERRRAEHAARLKTYAERLALALPEKRPAAARVSLRAVKAYAPETARKLAHLAQPPAPSVGEWKALPAEAQWPWLATPDSWARLDHDAMLPELRRVAAQPPEGADRLSMGAHLLWRAAMERLHELAPEEAGALLLAQLQQPRSPLASEARIRADEGFGSGTPSSLLDLLPAIPPEAQARLAANLEANPASTAALIDRLGDDSIYERVEAVYLRRAGEWACTEDWALLGYLVRVRPERDRTKCYRYDLGQVAGRLPEAERIAFVRRYVDDPDPEVARSASRILAESSP